MVTRASPKFMFAYFFLIIIIIIRCSGMFRDVPGYSGMFRNVPGCSMFLVLSTAIMETKRTKHNDGRERPGWQSVNTNICTEWRPGILRTKRHYQTHFTHVINTENVQQDGGVETQIYLPVDGIKNIILKTKRHETCYRTKFIHGIKTTCCTCEFFNKPKLRLCLGVRTFETHQWRKTMKTKKSA